VLSKIAKDRHPLAIVKRGTQRLSVKIAKDRHFFRPLHFSEIDLGSSLGLLPTVDMEYQRLFGIVICSYGKDCSGNFWIKSGKY
tara:strand:+ start:78 stop:329 length:252 start_codon:yes stop_codon:yes gene_type:complete